jgi:hypothetical protein
MVEENAGTDDDGASEALECGESATLLVKELKNKKDPGDQELMTDNGEMLAATMPAPSQQRSRRHGEKNAYGATTM